MKLHRWWSTGLVVVALGLGACSKQEVAAPAKASKQEVSIEAVTAQAKGFNVGALMSANTVYVFFDAQCPHCGHLWQASGPLQKKLKFVWIPIGMINATSTAQGAALLTAASPQTLMAEHEASLLAGKGGISASASVPPEIEQAIKANTQLFNGFGAESVPFVVAKNARTGQVVSQSGALDTAALAEFVGVDATP